MTESTALVIEIGTSDATASIMMRSKRESDPEFCTHGFDAVTAGDILKSKFYR